MVSSDVRVGVQVAAAADGGKRNEGGEMRIGEFAAAGATTPKTVRFYEEAGLLPPPARRSNGYRDYPSDALARLAFIRRSRAAGLSVAETRQVLRTRDGGEAPCEQVRDILDEHIADLDRQIADLRARRMEVARLLSAVETADPADCPPDAVCRYL